MHTMQYVATMVEIDEPTDLDEVKDIAASQVDSWLDENTGEYSSSWSDWATVGGRWEDYPILVYTDETACEFLEELDKIDSYQVARFNEYFAEFDFPTINSVMARFGAGEEVDYQAMYQANLYSLLSAIKIMKGYWTPDSKYFDMVNCVVQTKYLRETLLKSIDNPDPEVLYCLVPVDFHF